MTWNLVKLELACMNGDDGSLRKLHHPSFLAFCHRRQHPSALGSGSRSVRAACTHNKNLTAAFVVVERCGTPTVDAAVSFLNGAPFEREGVGCCTDVPIILLDVHAVPT